MQGAELLLRVPSRSQGKGVRVSFQSIHHIYLLKSHIPWRANIPGCLLCAGIVLSFHAPLCLPLTISAEEGLFHKQGNEGSEKLSICPRSSLIEYTLRCEPGSFCLQSPRSCTLQRTVLHLLSGHSRTSHAGVGRGRNGRKVCSN